MATEILTNDLVLTKTCTRCGETKPRTIDYFGRQGVGFRPCCKECYNSPRRVNSDKRVGPHTTVQALEVRLEQYAENIEQLIARLTVLEQSSINRSVVNPTVVTHVPPVTVPDTEEIVKVVESRIHPRIVGIMETYNKDMRILDRFSAIEAKLNIAYTPQPLARRN